MEFTLKRPCAKCPFRTDIQPFLRQARVREILSAIVDQQQTFTCHNTVDYSRADENDGEGRVTTKSQHCAGASILLEKIGRPNQMMRIAERLGAYRHTDLEMDSPVYDAPRAMIAAHKGA